jgi:formate dehydrogenase major subunit
MGYPMSYSSPNDIMNEIKELGPLYQESNHPTKEECSQLTNKQIHHKQATDKFCHFSIAEYTPSESPLDGYPLTLITGSTLYQFGTGVRSSRASRLQKFSPEAFIEISKPDAESIGIDNGDRVKISSPVGEVTATARITDTAIQGIIFMPLSSPKNSATSLFDYVLEPQAKTPALKTCSVNIERIQCHG